MPITGTNFWTLGDNGKAFCNDTFLLNCNLMHYATEGVLNPLPP